ncbi:alanine racemase [Bacillus sp. OG2]|uniref:alanine racemase n=1 Tax=Bacillus infantis TaxID=324767 RepID=UPI000B9B6139|nr:alanine racemase [Bacillus sp. OG2]
MAMDYPTGFYRDTWAEINLDHIKENVKTMKKLLPGDVKLFAVVKANGYGHGDIQAAGAALEAGADCLAVAFLDEALSLRQRGIEAPILVLGASRPEDAPLAASADITLTVFQVNWLEKALPCLQGKRLTFHVKLDTGMGRIGVREKDELLAIEKLAGREDAFELQGIYTHFATADELDDSYFREQLGRFREMLSWLGKVPEMVHTSNSAASLRFPEARFNAVRMGISMYGLTPSPEIEHELPFPLKEAFSLHARIVHVKKLQKGDKVSYGATYEAEGDEWIGTLPIGYADGWIRRLQGQEVLVNGSRVPIVGRICMDQCMIRLPYGVEPGTAATLIGAQGDSMISVNEIAAKLETINYEVTCMISSRVPRVYKQEEKTVDLNNPLLGKQGKL